MSVEHTLLARTVDVYIDSDTDFPQVRALEPAAEIHAPSGLKTWTPVTVLGSLYESCRQAFAHSWVVQGTR